MYAVDRINSSYRAVWNGRPSYNFFFVSVQLLSRKPVFFSITRHIIPKSVFFLSYDLIRVNTSHFHQLMLIFFFVVLSTIIINFNDQTRKKESVLNCYEWLLLCIIFCPDFWNNRLNNIYQKSVMLLLILPFVYTAKQRVDSIFAFNWHLALISPIF